LYLQRIKQQVAEEERRVADILDLNRKSDDAPPGHRVMPDDERQEIVDLLQARKRELDKQHAKLPLRIETDSQRRRALELERNLQDVEDNLQKFSKRVLVKI